MQLDDDGGQATSRSRKGRRDQASEPALCQVITLKSHWVGRWLGWSSSRRTFDLRSWLCLVSPAHRSWLEHSTVLRKYENSLNFVNRRCLYITTT